MCLADQTEKKNRRVVVSMDPRQASLNPPPNYRYGTVERSYFLDAVSDVCLSAFLQVMDRGDYNERARRNRERVSREQTKERLELALLNREHRTKQSIQRAA